jgi:hypothetical protein
MLRTMRIRAATSTVRRTDCDGNWSERNRAAATSTSSDVHRRIACSRLSLPRRYGL